MAAPRTFARVVSIEVQETFHAATDNQLKAIVEVENTSDYTHSTQVVFRGYVRRTNALSYEFLHEQVWLLIKPNGIVRNEVTVNVWLNRFPPTMSIDKDTHVEYSVRASVDPWFENKHIEKIFSVERTLVLKSPHEGSFPKKVVVNKCVDHGGWGHKKCKPINGELWTEKGCYAHGEVIRIRWRLKHESMIHHVKVSLIKMLTHRIPDPGHQQLTTTQVETVAHKEIKITSEQDNYCELTVPTTTPVTMTMSLWNVSAIHYELLLEVKTKANNKSVALRFPVIIANKAIESISRKRTHDNVRVFRRAHDKDDDTDDDDDYDSDLEEIDSAVDREYSIDIEKLQVQTVENGSLRDAYALVTFLVNSQIARPLRSLRLLFQGEVRANTCWYEFLRFKAVINSDAVSQFSPGQHTVRVALPFRESQYDTNILPPSLGDDIRYICKVSTETWRKNLIPMETDVFVDRMVDTWAREEYKTEHIEKLGELAITMKQRCFQRGRYAFAKVVGAHRGVQLELVQQRRLRVPGLKTDDSFCHQRTVMVQPPPLDRDVWPEEWHLRIPHTIPPSIEISYWNVLVLSYVIVVIVTLEDGHEHRHEVPIWIGCTDDKLKDPEPPKTIHENRRSPSLGELPEFEVVHTEETQIQPYWVERYNDQTYQYDL